MATSSDICRRSMRAVGALASGETPDSNEENEVFDMLNDLVDQLSNSPQFISYKTEIIFNLVGNVYQYTIGPGGTIGGTFTGSIAADVLTISAISAGGVSLGMTISGSGITSGTRITEFITGAGDTGTYRVSASQTVASTTITSYYQRPLRINSAFVRVASLDYPVWPLNIEQYELIGLKTLGGPWPKALYYQPSDPLGNITFWPVPQSGEMHMFADTLLQRFESLSSEIVLPQGYLMALRWCLAELLIPLYPATAAAAETRALIPVYAANARAWIKRTNMQPPQQMSFPDELIMGQRRIDAAWIYSGGFNA